MTDEEILHRASAALAPCAVTVKPFDCDTKIGVGWRHPNGGRHAIYARSTASDREQLVATIEGSRSVLVATAEWSKMRPLTLWEHITLWLRPKRRNEIKARHAALAIAAETDKARR